MAITIPHTFVAGAIAQSSTMNANFTAVQIFVDGLASGTNIDSSAITTGKINDAAVTSAKIADGTVTYTKLDSTTVLAGIANNDQVVLGSQIFG